MKEIEGLVIMLVVIREYGPGHENIGIAPLRANDRRHDETDPGEPDQRQEGDP
jgi:hypothetical protein